MKNPFSAKKMNKIFQSISHNETENATLYALENIRQQIIKITEKNNINIQYIENAISDIVKNNNLKEPLKIFDELTEKIIFKMNLLSKNDNERSHHIMNILNIIANHKITIMKLLYTNKLITKKNTKTKEDELETFNDFIDSLNI